VAKRKRVEENPENFNPRRLKIREFDSNQGK
jgi:hypothetical protein